MCREVLFLGVGTGVVYFQRSEGVDVMSITSVASEQRKESLFGMKLVVEGWVSGCKREGRNKGVAALINKASQGSGEGQAEAKRAPAEKLRRAR